jgi:DegV family protein with EDD domain
VTLLTRQNTGLVIDSTVDPWAHFQALEGIATVPLKVLFGDEAYDDGAELSIEDFYRKLASSPVMPTSSQPTPDRFEAAYAQMCERFEHVYSIHISSKMSGTLRVAREVAARFPRVHVVDSLTVSGGCGVLVQRVYDKLADGISADHLQAYFEHFWRRGRFIIQTPSLEYLRRGGRIRWSQQVVGGMLGIRPLVHANDGMIEACGKPRGERRAFEMMGEYLRQNIEPHEGAYVGLLHANWPESIATLRELVRTVRPDAHLMMEGSVGCVIGVHIGPRASALMFVGE